ncbi:hypothetical protein V490_03310 [Pseudogymnoascus sp. VKM F-3557]|nr:hypothetical protein V490_03310 [Pseudogymnoascus sp. VKM F-3557]
MHTNLPPLNGEDNNNRRWFINSLLIPKENTASSPSRGAYSSLSRPPRLSTCSPLSRPSPIPPTQSHIPPPDKLLDVQRSQLLPSLRSLDLLPAHVPQPIYQDHPAPQPAISCHDVPSSSSRSSMSPRSSRSEPPPSTPHSNVPYTLEQVHFIQYHRDDKTRRWQAIADSFGKQFHKIYIQLGNTPNRRKGALECRYYRAQMYPKMDDEGNIVLDQNDQVAMVNIRVRDRNSHPHSSILENYFKLVTRCPEKVLTYSWTDEADKEKARAIIADRATRGKGRLTGDILRVREAL